MVGCAVGWDAGCAVGWVAGGLTGCVVLPGLGLVGRLPWVPLAGCVLPLDGLGTLLSCGLVGVSLVLRGDCAANGAPVASKNKSRRVRDMLV